jgi:drug/metabolite transporter (DMT)-like permease
MKNLSPQLRGIVLILSAVFLFAALDASSKWLTKSYPVPMLVWARYTVHLLLMLIFLLPTRGRRLWVTQRPLIQIGRAMMLLGATTCIFFSFSSTPLTIATAILFITPLLIGLLSHRVLGEKVAASQGVAIVTGLIGMLLMARPGGEAPLIGVLFAIAAALFNTAYQLLTRMIAPTESSVTMLFYTALTGTVLSSLLLPWFGTSISPPPLDVLRIISLGVLGGSGHFLLILAFREARAATLAPFLYVQLVWAGMFDLLVFGHVPDGPTWLGVALIAGAGLSIVVRERLNARSRSALPPDTEY